MNDDDDKKDNPPIGPYWSTSMPRRVGNWGTEVDTNQGPEIILNRRADGETQKELVLLRYPDGIYLGHREKKSGEQWGKPGEWQTWTQIGERELLALVAWYLQYAGRIDAGWDCKECGHPIKKHKGGRLRCSVEGCYCTRH